MANPPYTAMVIVLVEGPDGITAEALAWDELLGTNPSVLDAPRIDALLQSLKQASPKPTYTSGRRFATTRATLKTLFGGVVDAKFPETA